MTEKKIAASVAMLKVLEAWGVKDVYGYPGGSFNSTMKALDIEKENINFEKEVTIPKEKFCNKLGITCNDIIISNIKRNSTNRVESIIINGKKFTGIEVRKTLGLRSTDFVIKLNENDINITTYGYGHGVGMSQYGANYLANQGFNYEYILKYYYKDVIISSIN